MGLKSKKRKQLVVSDPGEDRLVKVEHASQADAEQKPLQPKAANAEQAPVKKKMKVKTRKLSASHDSNVFDPEAANAEQAPVKKKMKVKKRKLSASHDSNANPKDRPRKKAKVSGESGGELPTSREGPRNPTQKESAAALEQKQSGLKDVSQGLTLIIGGLPFSSTPEILSKDFSKCGKICKISLPKDPKSGLARGFAFISFAAQEGVQTALKFDGKDYRGRRITARIAGDKPDNEKQKKVDAPVNDNNPLRIFVAGLPHEVAEHKVREYFARSGEIKNLKLPLNDAGQPKGFAFVTYATKQSLDDALQLNGKDFGGRSIVVRLAHDGGQKGNSSKGGGRANDGPNKGMGKGQGKVKNDPELTVFVSGFPYFTTEKKLKNFFNKCGKITDFKLPMCSWDESQSRGFAFIRYNEGSSVDKALELDGKDFQGRYLSVKRAGDPAVKDENQNESESKKNIKGLDKNHGKGTDAGKKTATGAEQLTEKEKRNSGVLVKSTGKKLVFESDDDE